jgi:hypothetical protein
MEGGAVGQNFERDPPRDHPCQVLFNLVQQFNCVSIMMSFLAYYRNFYEL